MSKEFIGELSLNRAEESFRAGVCFCFFEKSGNWLEKDSYLHPQEHEYFNALKFEKRRKDYLLGRYCAKRAIQVLEQDARPENIFIDHGVFSQPVVINRGNMQVSIAHSGSFGASVAFSESCPMGIDIERVDINKSDVLESQMTKEETKLIDLFPFSYQAALTSLWTSKESLSKALKTGLTTPFHSFEISRIEVEGRYVTGYFRNFAQYKAISFDLNNLVCSITYPKDFKLYIDVNSLENFSVSLRK